MRVIKFRVWDNIEKKFLPDLQGLSFFYDFPSSGPQWLGLDDLNKIDSEPKRFIIQQYTGLNDSEGKEIYEGDVIQYKFWNKNKGFWTEESSFDEWTGIIEFEQGAFCIHYYDGPSDDICFFNQSLIREIKVVGNIFEK